MNDRPHADGTNGSRRDDRNRFAPRRDRGRDPDWVATADTSAASEGHDAPDLQLTVVSNPDGPDRGTLSPRGLTGMERMETWLSVNASVAVDLAAWR